MKQPARSAPLPKKVATVIRETGDAAGDRFPSACVAVSSPRRTQRHALWRRYTRPAPARISRYRGAPRGSVAMAGRRDGGNGRSMDGQCKISWVNGRRRQSSKVVSKTPRFTSHVAAQRVRRRKGRSVRRSTAVALKVESWPPEEGAKATEHTWRECKKGCMFANDSLRSSRANKFGPRGARLP